MKFLGKMVLKLRDVKVVHHFFFENFFRKCEKSTLKISHSIAILDRFKNYYLRNFTKKNDEQICTSLSFRITLQTALFYLKKFVTQNHIILQKFGPN